MCDGPGAEWGLSDCFEDEKLAEKIRSMTEALELPAGFLLFEQGAPCNGVFYVEEGAAVLTMHAGESVVMQVSTGPGSLLGLPAVVGSRPYAMSAQMSTAGIVRALDSGEFMDALRNDQKCSLSVLRILAAEIRAAQQAMKRLVR